MPPERYIDDTIFQKAIADLLKARTPDEAMLIVGEAFNVWPAAIEQAALIGAIVERGLLPPASIG